MKILPKVLIVDDKSENLFSLEQLLAELNVDVVTAASGNEALAKTLDNEFAIALVDVQMPDMNGFETAELMRKNSKTKNLPIIFISAVYRKEYHQIKGIEIGAVDFITKPIVPEILLGKVRIFLELFRYRQSLENQIATRTKELENIRMAHEQKREIDTIDRFSKINNSKITAKSYGMKSSRESQPELFNNLIKKYENFLDLALEKKTYKEKIKISDKLRLFADELGAIRSGPQDIVEIHKLAIREKSKNSQPKKIQAYIEEGRYILLEIMGDLVSHYRQYYVR